MGVGPRVWVAGHRGMVGSAVAAALEARGDNVLRVDRTRVDLRDQAAVTAWLTENRPEQIILAAGKVGGIHANDSFPADFIYDNLMIAANVINAAHLAGVDRLVYLGSSCIYPKFAPQPIAEDALLTGTLEPTNEWYAMAKIAGIKLCQAYRKQYGRRYISVMPCNLYGPGDNFDLATSHVLPALMRKFHEAKIREAPEVVVWGSGTPLREFLHVDDLARGVIACLDLYDGYEHINCGAGTEVSILALARTIQAAVGYEGNIVFDASKPDGTPRKVMDSTRIAGLGWRPEITLAAGIAETYQWFLQLRAGGLAPAGWPRAARWRLAPKISILVPTDTRAAALDNLLNCLRFLNGPDFEVVVIRGPTDNGMSEVLAKWQHAIKITKNPERNTSKSRNLGITLAAGDIIALVDDDGLPEPDWLVELTQAFDDPAVGTAGGTVVDHIGTGWQLPFITVNRLGHMNMSWPAEQDFNMPHSYDFPFAPGVNSAFRRVAFLEVGGFDEAYEYYYDETDLCCRLVDAGWLIRQMPGAVVHHKMLASHIRTETRIMRDMYPALHGKLYFSLVNNHGHYPESRALEDFNEYARAHEAHFRNLIAIGHLPESDLDRFKADVARAREAGIRRGLNRERQLLSPESCAAPPEFLPFPRLLPAGGRQRLVFAGAPLESAARAAGALGHHVHLVLPGEGHDRVDFEETIWIHRFLAPDDAVCHVALRFDAETVYVAGPAAGITTRLAVAGARAAVVNR